MTSPPWIPPPFEEVQALHERYLHEIVIELNVCPFAQRSVQLGRVQRLWWTQPSADHQMQGIVDRFEQCVSDSELEIVLLSFVLPPADPHQDATLFEDWHRSFRQALADRGLAEQWYSVCFHPHPKGPKTPPKTPAALVPTLRRTPDPVIQCVRVATLDEVRDKAQAKAQAELLQTLKAQDPSLAVMAQSCVMTDSQLSVSIARKNHEALGEDPGWAKLCATLESILSARRALEPRASCAKETEQGRSPDAQEFS